jgi:hypothetical protein
MKLKESLDNVLDYEMQYMGMGYKYTFNLKEEFNINLKIIVNILVDDYEMFVNFKADGPDNELSTEKKASFAIFATLVEILDEASRKQKIVTIQGIGDTFKKGLIYEKLFKRFIPENWEVNRTGTAAIAQKKSKL